LWSPGLRTPPAGNGATTSVAPTFPGIVTRKALGVVADFSTYRKLRFDRGNERFGLIDRPGRIIDAYRIPV
jgi:hypothetical protein